MLLAYLNLEGLIRKIQRRRRGTHLAQGGSPGPQGRRNAPPLAQPHPRKRLFALLWQIRLARIPLKAVSNLRLSSVSIATASSSPLNVGSPRLVRSSSSSPLYFFGPTTLPASC